MFVLSIRRLCHHWKMAPSHHLRMPRQMSPPWTLLQWKHCWPKQPTSIRRLLQRCHRRMYRLPQGITIQRGMERLSFQRNLQDRAISLNYPQLDDIPKTTNLIFLTSFISFSLLSFLKLFLCNLFFIFHNVILKL